MDQSRNSIRDPAVLQGFSPAEIKPLIVGERPLSSQIQCLRCGRALPLRLSSQGERAVRWLCSRCGLPFAALCIRDRLPELASYVRLDLAYFDTSGLPEIPVELRKFIARLAEARARADADDRRRSPRVSQSLVVPAVELDEGLSPLRPAIRVMVADISPEGIRLVHSAAIEAEMLALELSPAGLHSIQVIVQLVRQRPLQGHFYELGGQFMVRLGE